MQNQSLRGILDVSGQEMDDYTELSERQSDFEPTLSSQELAVLARRDLAQRTTDAISEVLDVDVTVPMLLALADKSEDDSVRLPALRALRCIESIAREDNPIVRRIGEAGIYHYAEGVIEFGASERKYMALLDTFGLDAEAVTGLYALRDAIAAETDGRNIGFDTILSALSTLGIGPHDAAADIEEAVRALGDAGFFIDHAGSKTFNQPIFSPNLAGKTHFGRNIDSYNSAYGSLPDEFEVPFSGDFPEEAEG